MGNVNNTPDTEVNVPAIPKADAPVEQKEGTVADVLGNARNSESVPLATFLEEKTQRKDLEKRLKNIETKQAQNKDVSSDLKTLAEKHNVDEDLLSDIANTIRSQTEAKLSEKLKPILEKDREASFNKVFDENFKKTVENNPRFKGVVNKEVIRAMSLDPRNASKTFTNLMEDGFGHLIKQKKSFEAGTQSGSPDTGLDFAKAQTDTAYFDKVMADPKLKEEYNAKRRANY